MESIYHVLMTLQIREEVEDAPHVEDVVAEAVGAVETLPLLLLLPQLRIP
jgi:hypothetical protein